MTEVGRSAVTQGNSRRHCGIIGHPASPTLIPAHVVNTLPRLPARVSLLKRPLLILLALLI